MYDISINYHNGYDGSAIPKAMQISTNTAKSRYRYGIDKLRVTLNGEVTKCNQQTT